jgi:hypothetical protein
MSQSPIDYVDDPAQSLDLTETEYHRLLADTDRRTVLDVLGAQSTPIDLHELGRAVATEKGESGESERDAIEHARVALHHIHLPLMDDLGVIEYDQESRRVERTLSS